MHIKTVIDPQTLSRMLKYYTPDLLIFQVNLVKFTIFVNYADFYVNAIMLTFETIRPGYLPFCMIAPYIDISKPLTHKMLFCKKNCIVGL